MTDEQKYDLIERYLDQQLSASERSDFERKLENDPALREELELHQQLAETLGGTEVHQFRAELKAINQRWQVPVTEKKSTFFSLSSNRCDCCDRFDFTISLSIPENTGYACSGSLVCFKF